MQGLNNPVMEKRTKLPDPGILPIRVHPIGQKNDHQFAFRVDPEGSAGKAEMADT